MQPVNPAPPMCLTLRQLALIKAPRRRVALLLHAGLAWLLATASSEALASSALVATLDGRTLEGELTAWNRDQLTLQTAAGPETVSAADLLDIRWPRDVAADPASRFVEFIDGTRIAYDNIAIAERTATLTGPHFDGPGSIAQQRLRLAELQGDSPAVVAAIENARKNRPPGDVLIIRKRDGEAADYIAGVLGDLTAEQAAFQWEGEQVPVKRDKIAAILFHQGQQPALADAAAELTLADGSRIAVREARLDGERLAVKTPAGVTLRLGLEDLHRANFSEGKIAYLSDLEPELVVWTPRIGLPPDAPSIARFGEPRRDQSFSGSPLALLWKDDPARSRREVRTYSKGLALRSRTEATYRVPEGMRVFSAAASIDPDAASQGHVLLQIRGDDRVLWEEAIAGSQPPREIKLDLAGARRLHVLVDYGDNLDFGDRLHLAEARFTK
ncbi:MAG: hypothetical protein DCC67_05755 [Planctomycetota bacterium]|nr:MAG: hypothetical protein DCC67_05755 [Planctomycetota bacterium]